MKLEVVKFRGWKMVKNEDGYYNLYTPDEVESYSNKDLLDWGCPEMEVGSIEDGKQFILSY